uniref:SpaM n=1 Tax=Spirochaeta aurantia TaxID=147 RepID=Q0PHZ5_SPIAU|nr:SpaM [Spirochaeta aurantia]
MGRTLVAGGAGFLGAHLVRRLATKTQVVVVDDLSAGQTSVLEEFKALGVTTLVMDCRETKALVAALQSGDTLDRIIHLAANSDIRRSALEPEIELNKTFETTVSLLAVAAALGCNEFIFASSSAVYGDWPGQRLSELTPCRPISYYGAAKLASEAFIAAAVHNQPLAACILRLPNVIGSGMTHGVLVDFVEKLRRDPRVLSILGDGSQRKSFLLVDEVVDVMVLPGIVPTLGVSTYNVAVDDNLSIQEVARIVLRELRLKDVTISCGTSPNGWVGDVRWYLMDGSSLALQGWRAQRSSSEAVTAAIRQLGGLEGFASAKA